MIAYLYDDMDPSARAVFGVHLAACEVCRDELRVLGGVRQQLAHWTPPEPGFVRAATSNPQSAIPNPQWWRAVPVWAQVAAAMLFLGVSAGVANLDVHYDNSGLTVRTGWSRGVANAPAVAATSASAQRATTALASPTASVITRDDLAALARQLRTEFHAAQTPMRTVSTGADPDLMRRVHALISETEKRQQRELALRIGEVLRDVNAQRQADLGRIDRSLGLVRNDIGVEVLKQRQSLNYLMRVNQR